jgi:hypothetical protein
MAREFNFWATILRVESAMRDALVIGALYAAVGAIVAALAVKYAEPSSLWDIILWGGVAMAPGNIASSNGEAFFVAGTVHQSWDCFRCNWICVAHMERRDRQRPFALFRRYP